jgi:hypothetical protein
MIYDFVGIDAMTRNPVEHLVATHHKRWPDTCEAARQRPT